MPVDENTRLRLRQRFTELMDEDLADAIMESMPPVPWTDLATKNDIARLDGRFDRVDERLDKMDQRFDLIDQRLGGFGRQFEKIDDQFAISNDQFRVLSEGLHHEMVGLEGRLALRLTEPIRVIVFTAMLLFVGVGGVMVTVLA